MKRSVLRLAAERDVKNGFLHYFEQAGKVVAGRFLYAIDSAIRHIEQFPGSGSTRFSELLDVPELRSWILKNFPFTLFYIERDDHVDVIRLLHQHTDMPVQLHDEI